MNTTTRSYPRTMEQAFGPGHRGGIYESRSTLDKHDRIVVAASGVAAVVLLIVLIFN